MLCLQDYFIYMDRQRTILIITGAGLTILPFLLKTGKDINKIVFENAFKYLGWNEKQEPDFIRYIFAELGYKNASPDWAWCSAFVNYILKISGAYYTNKLNARSFLNYPQPPNLKITPETAKQGDIAIFSRGNNNYLGHTGFIYRYDPIKKRIYILGGNQSDSVNIQPFKLDRLLKIVRPIEATAV